MYILTGIWTQNVSYLRSKSRYIEKRGFLYHMVNENGCHPIGVASGGYRKKTNFLSALHIEGGIHTVHVLLVQFFPQKLYGFTETLEMNNFPLTEEFDNIIHIRVIGKTKNIIVGYSGFLL